MRSYGKAKQEERQQLFCCNARLLGFVIVVEFTRQLGVYVISSGVVQMKTAKRPCRVLLDKGVGVRCGS